MIFFKKVTPGFYVADCHCDEDLLRGDEDSKTSTATVNYLLRLQKRVMFVTNNSNKTRAQFVQQTLDGNPGSIFSTQRTYQS